MSIQFFFVTINFQLVRTVFIFSYPYLHIKGISSEFDMYQNIYRLFYLYNLKNLFSFFFYSLRRPFVVFVLCKEYIFFASSLFKSTRNKYIYKLLCANKFFSVKKGCYILYLCKSFFYFLFRFFPRLIVLSNISYFFFFLINDCNVAQYVNFFLCY